MSSLKITWLGHASVMLEHGLTILLDPWIEGNPACARPLADFTKVDLICVTHGHNDHLGDALPLCKQTGAKLICRPEIASTPVYPPKPQPSTPTTQSLFSG